ncbi:hypothetical protein BDE02_03G199200 [Populus trichocarpa]|nr:hypothetical protein BDE02_03G199200 [Populus trichocarpa]
MVELEESRRKLVNLKMQRDAAVGMHTPAPSAVNGNLSPEKTTDRSKRFWELRDSLDEMKILAADRLSELENQTLSKELEDLEDELKDDKHIHSSHLYSLVKVQLQHWNDEVERYKTLTDSLQVIYLGFFFPVSFYTCLILNVLEIKESECRAHSQAEVLKSSLDEHSLELRVKAAIGAEAACHQRLSATEAEKAGLRAKLDASERDVFEFKEAIKSKDKEAESIGQAYEDMQTQNQHLLQQVGERDDYNIKQSFLLSEKQALAKHLQQVNASVESLKSRIAHSEEQMKHYVIEAVRSTKEDRHVAINLESALLELMDAEKELKWLKYAIQKKIDEIQTELVSERSERKMLEEELMELNNRVAELTSETGEAAIQRLQDEIKDCKSMLKCSVCSDRPKEVVIVKCYHLFCNP